MCRRRDSLQFLRNYSPWREGRRELLPGLATATDGVSKRACGFAHSAGSLRGARTETSRSLSVFTLRAIGSSQWALSISRLKGLCEDTEERGLCAAPWVECRLAAAATATATAAASRQMGTPRRDQPSSVEIKSVRFPRVSERSISARL